MIVRFIGRRSRVSAFLYGVIFMFMLSTEACFDSAHFLSGYHGKCSNIHGHRWKIIVEIMRSTLDKDGQTAGMVTDFGDLKRDLKHLADEFDHCLIIERGTLKQNTLDALYDENFNIKEVAFRPTAEEFARYFYFRMKDKGYLVKKLTVYETPNNCAAYTEEI